jgi:hypothetical protein
MTRQAGIIGSDIAVLRNRAATEKKQDRQDGEEHFHWYYLPIIS